MKPIAIVEKNKAKIEAALEEVNGRATAHTYTSYAEIEQEASAAEKRLGGLLLKKDFQGAICYAESGSAVAKSYKNTRIGTRIKIRRGSSAWFLESIEAITLYTDGGHAQRLALTQEQDVAAKAKLSTLYAIQKTEHDA